MDGRGGEARADHEDKEKERGGTREGSGRAPGQRRCGYQLLHHWILLFPPQVPHSKVLVSDFTGKRFRAPTNRTHRAAASTAVS